MQRGICEFTLQLTGGLIYISNPFAHAVSTLDTGSPTILFGCDAATSSNQQTVIQTWDKYALGVRGGKCCEIFSKKKFISTKRVVVFSRGKPSGRQGKVTKTFKILRTS